MGITINLCIANNRHLFIWSLRRVGSACLVIGRSSQCLCQYVQIENCRIGTLHCFVLQLIVCNELKMHYLIMLPCSPSSRPYTLTSCFKGLPFQFLIYTRSLVSIITHHIVLLIWCASNVLQE